MEGKKMSFSCGGWKNKNGTGERTCICGSWSKHWLNFSNKEWPIECSVEGCHNYPVLGAHVINAFAPGEYIVPMCDSCNKLSGTFNLKIGVIPISANTKETCEK